MKLESQLKLFFKCFSFLFLISVPSFLRADTTSPTPGESYQFYLKALLLESQGNFIAANAELDKALEVSPDSAYLHRTAAELLLKIGQVSKAGDEADKANELDPKDVKALILAGQIQWALGNPEKAEAKLKKALSIDPDESEALVSLAGALSPKDPKQAIKLYKDFLVRHPGEVEIEERLAQLYQASGDMDSAKATWDKALELAPSSLRAHLALAQIAEVNYDTATAISHYDAVLVQDPTNLPLLLRVGELRYRNNDMAKAYEAFSKAQKISPTSASANFWLALLAEHKGDWNEAIRLLLQVPNKGEDPGILLRLSYYYSQAGRFKDAIKVLKQLSDNDPSNTDFLNYLAIAYEQDGQYVSAEKILKRIMEVDPNDPLAHFHLATLYDRTSQFQKAEAELKLAIQLKPDYAMAMNYLGYSYADRGTNLEEAEKLVNAALGIEPENPAYLDSMGWVYFRLKKYDKATDFLRAATLRAHDPLIWEHLGDVELAKGDTIQAILAWDESLRAEPQSKSARSKIDQAMRHVSPHDKLGLFVKRAVSNFGDIDTISGLVNIVVKQKSPAFESKANLSYTRTQELKVEIPGPLSGPLMLLTKKPGEPVKFGAVHPLFQSAEPYVTRAFTRLDDLISANLFRSFDLTVMAENAKESNGRLEASMAGVHIFFRLKDGTVDRIEWNEGQGMDVLSLGSYGGARDFFLPKSIEWFDKQSSTSIRLDFLSPAISTDLEKQPDPEDDESDD